MKWSRNQYFQALVFVALLCIQGNAAEDDFLHRGVPPSFLEIYLKQFPPVLSQKAFVSKPIELPDDPTFKPVGLEVLPSLADDMEVKATKTGKVHANGLLATINYEEFQKREASGCKHISIPKELTGFQKDIRACLYLQPGKAPLAVPLLGFGMLADGKSAQTYQADLFKAGNHVLCTDSIVTNTMNECTGHGVAGNPVAEAEVTGKIIDAFLKMTDAESKKTFRETVSSVRLLGTSWGGIISMHVLRLPQAKTWPIDRSLILSIPINLKTTAFRLDQFQREDRNRTSIFQLAKLHKGYTPRENDPNEEENTWMRAGIGFVFHGDLGILAKSNIKRYSPELLDNLKTFEAADAQIRLRRQYEEEMLARHKAEELELEKKKDSLDNDRYSALKSDLKEKHKAESDYSKRSMTDLKDWSFKHYVFLLARTFWGLNGDLTDAVRLSDLLKGVPNFTQVIISADDPLNDPAEVSALREQYKEPQLIVLPHGGHLGYNGTAWLQSMMSRFFAASR